MTSFQQARIDLGSQLRQLREAAHLSGKELAERLRWQPSKVSRLENARQTATEDDVVVWAQAVNASPDTTDELIRQSIALLERHDDWKQRHRSGLAAIQEDIRDLEARTKVFRVFEPGIIVGLLQTSEYARHVFRKVKRLYSAADQIDAAVRVRMQRQEILYDRTRTFRFVVTEATLRTALAPPEVMRGQLDRLLAVSTLPNVEFGVIPFATELPANPVNGFWIYNEAMVAVATMTKDLILRDPDDIAFYVRAFDDYAKAAEFGEAGREVIISILHDYRKQSPH
ncbi:Putative DNA-binding protein in cluster with Type I restriction-modification system [[Actinomadura] parvosata subsp. kistnae]|uniref:Transcriptional regulator n=1 Tax=[Actinomadura] parvosata subsp. kistnae TaxID=1909395 RepID=A0A1U9ZRF0_9ACTN|nr:helix-turn-helix transcriptional regulator [Nonomuraea sp. ATCC 55076]AQZ60519.1 transcriptional regulator [Nonomuraea sp. ATCC 55076]SPL90924.1 Putative DNA-binding protein in cluster with Type I restriction-modification system [Actinomadura parvosata subsp. kistnae]